MAVNLNKLFDWKWANRTLDHYSDSDRCDKADHQTQNTRDPCPPNRWRSNDALVVVGFTDHQHFNQGLQWHFALPDGKWTLSSSLCFKWAKQFIRWVCCTIDIRIAVIANLWAQSTEQKRQKKDLSDKIGLIRAEWNCHSGDGASNHFAAF